MLIKGLLLLALSVNTAFAQKLEHRQIVPTPEGAALNHTKQVGPTDPNKEITFTVWLKLRNTSEMDQQVKALYDPVSSSYQQFLSYEEVMAKYAPDVQAIQTVTDFFQQKGLHVKQVYTNLEVTGTVNQIEQLFNIKIKNHQYDKRIVYGQNTAPSLNERIASYISGISGLSNMPYAHPKSHRVPQPSVPKDWKPEILNFSWKSFVPTVLPTTTSLQGISGEHLRIAYNLANVAPINGTPIDGSGQTIVIIDGCGNSTPTEIMNHSNDYNTHNNLPQLSSSNFVVLDHQGNAYNGNCPNPSGWDGEILLDVQASHTIAPGANIVLILTDDVDNGQVAQALFYIESNHFTLGVPPNLFPNAYVVSNSWDNDFENNFELLEAPLQIAAMQGMSINFAAGDCGDQTYSSSWPCPGFNPVPANPTVQYPVSSPFVTAVSGTSLFVDNAWNYAFEEGWGTRVNGAFYSGSMGGISQFRNSPPWQSVISNFFAGGYNNGTIGSYNKRALPDIAMLGDLYTGLLTYSNGCNPCYDGGASLATPLFSGVLTLVNQARYLLAGNTSNPLGLAAPYLYTNNLSLLQTRALNLVSPPHEIVSGASPISGGPLSSFKLNDSFFGEEVGFGWDSALTIIEDQFWNDVVGVGSPNIPNFVQVMATL